MLQLCVELYCVLNYIGMLIFVKTFGIALYNFTHTHTHTHHTHDHVYMSTCTSDACDCAVNQTSKAIQEK